MKEAAVTRGLEAEDRRTQGPGEVGVWNRSRQCPDVSGGWKKQKEDNMALDKLAPGAEVDETERS